MWLKLVRDVDQLALVKPVAIGAALEVWVALPVVGHASTIDTHALLVVARTSEVPSRMGVALASSAKHEAASLVLLLLRWVRWEGLRFAIGHHAPPERGLIFTEAAVLVFERVLIAA